MKAVIYCRTSTDERADSCADQERVAREKAKELGANVVAVYTDEGISGTDSSRPAYQRMMAAANAKEFDTLLLWKLNRLGRHAPIREMAMRRLENIHGVRIVTIDHYDTSKDSAKNRKLNRGFTGQNRQRDIRALFKGCQPTGDCRRSECAQRALPRFYVETQGASL